MGATAKQIARAVRRGDVSATQVVADHLDQIAISDPSLDAFRVVRGGEAITEAEKVDEQEDLANLPLAGVPVAVKENTAVAGLPTWHGSAAARSGGGRGTTTRWYAGCAAPGRSSSGSPGCRRWGSGRPPTTQHGATRNPWDLDRTPGGSSGGSAAAVAAGLVPIAQGNDGLGSIRIPAACCGLVGLKPGRGVVPCQLGVNDWFGLAEHGVLTTTVADAVLGFSVLAGRPPAKLVEPQRLRVGVSTRSPVVGVRPDEPNRSARGHGRPSCSSRPATTRSPPSRAIRRRSGIAGAGHLVRRPPATSSRGSIDVSRLQPRTRRHIQLGRWAGRSGLVRQAHRDAWRERSIEFFADRRIDLLLTPALAAAPPAGRAVLRSGRGARNMAVNMRYAPYAAPVERRRPAGDRRPGRPAPGRAAARRPARRPARLRAAAARRRRAVRGAQPLAAARLRLTRWHDLTA